MATTGLLLCLYLVIHFVGNLMLFGGEDTFNAYVDTLATIKPLVRVIEVLLALIFIGHIFFGVKLSAENKKASPYKYALNKAGENSTIFSRSMGITGSLLFIFLITHLSTIWYWFQAEHSSTNFYEIVVGDTVGFGNPIITAMYSVAMILLGFHLYHGFQSAFQTFGLRYNKYSRLIEVIAVLFWFIIPAGFFTIAFYFGVLGAR